MKILEQAAALAKAATAFGSTILLQPTYPVGGVVGGLGDFQYGATGNSGKRGEGHVVRWCKILSLFPPCLSLSPFVSLSSSHVPFV